MKKTEILELPQFERPDPITPDDVNVAFRRIDNFAKTVSAPAVVELKKCADRAEAGANQAKQSAQSAETASVQAIAAANLAASNAAEVRAKAQQAVENAAKAEVEANRAQAEADRATVPPVAGVYSIILQDRATGSKYALIVEDSVLALIETSDRMTPADVQMVDNQTGRAYVLAVANGILRLEEL